MRNDPMKLWTVELYLDDLAAIVDILQEWKYTNLKILTQDSEYSIDELEKIEVKDGYLVIETSTPEYISIHFETRSSYAWVRVYFSNQKNVNTDWVKYRLKELLHGRWRNILNFLTNWVFLGISIFIAIILALYFWGTLIEYFTIFFSIYIPTLWLFSLPIRSNKIYIKKKDSASFWDRSKDAIIIWLVVTIIGGIIVWVVLKHLDLV